MFTTCKVLESIFLNSIYFFSDLYPNFGNFLPKKWFLDPIFLTHGPEGDINLFWGIFSFGTMAHGPEAEFLPSH